MKLTDEEGRSIAKELGLRYDGIQEGFGDVPTQYQFTDMAVTGTTFYGNTLRAVKANLAEKRKLFKEAEVTNPRTESERLSFHERIFGKGSTPPLERLRRGQTVNELLPMPPDQGPPLPRGLNIKWPGKK